MLLFTKQICFSLNTRTQARSEKIIVTKTHKDTPYVHQGQTDESFTTINNIFDFYKRSFNKAMEARQVCLT